MKYMFLNHSLLTLLLFAFVAITLPSCDKDEETPEPTFTEKLVGTWDITSYVLDGDELKSLIGDSAFITFEPPVGNSGIFRQEVDFINEETVSLSGRYIIDETNMQVTMFYEGEEVVVDITFTGTDEMLWEGSLGGNPLVLHLTKRQ
ncbi:MAG TPA: hypothetical protein VGK46_11530 [Saprospiraceae bacterium]